MFDFLQEMGKRQHKNKTDTNNWLSIVLMNTAAFPTSEELVDLRIFL